MTREAHRRAAAGACNLLATTCHHICWRAPPVVNPTFDPGFVLQGLVVRALPASSLDDDDDMQWEAADYGGDSGAGTVQHDAASAPAGAGPGGYAAGEAFPGSPPASWEDRPELHGALRCLLVLCRWRHA